MAPAATLFRFEQPMPPPLSIPPESEQKFLLVAAMGDMLLPYAEIHKFCQMCRFAPYRFFMRTLIYSGEKMKPDRLLQAIREIIF